MDPEHHRRRRRGRIGQPSHHVGRQPGFLPGDDPDDRTATPLRPDTRGRPRDCSNLGHIQEHSNPQHRQASDTTHDDVR